MSARRALSLLRPLFLFSLPLWLPLVHLPGVTYRSITGNASQSLPVPIYFGYPFLVSFPVELGAVLLFQVAMTLARLHAGGDALERRKRIGRALLFLVTLLALTSLNAGTIWPWLLCYAPAVDRLPPTVILVAVTLAVAFLALESSRRGPWSGLIALYSGLNVAALSRPATAALRAHPETVHADIVGVVLVLAGLAAVATLGIQRSRRKPLDLRAAARWEDLAYAPFALYALAAVLFVGLEIAQAIEHTGYRDEIVGSTARALLVVASLVTARAIDPDEDTLARAGLGALFRRQELVLVPWALGAVAAALVRIRLFAAARSQSELFFPAPVAESIAASSVPSVIELGVVGLACLALGPYLAWIARQPRGEESASPAATDPTATSG